MAASKFLGAMAHGLSISGTAHSPLPLHMFSPGFSPHPPSPAHSFIPLHVCSFTVGKLACPAHSFFFPLTSSLQWWFSPRQTCGSWSHGNPSFFGSLCSGFLSSARVVFTPAINPPTAAAVSFANCRRLNSLESMTGPRRTRTRRRRECPPPANARATSVIRRSGLRTVRVAA